MNVGDAIVAILPQLRRVARNVAGRNDYEDVLHDAIHKTIRNNTPTAQRCAQNSAEMFPYMVTVIYHQALHHKRTTPVFREYTPELDEKISIVNTDLSSRKDNELIDLAINHLDEPDRSIFLLYSFIDFDFERFATETDIPVQALYHSVYRSKKKLRKWIRKD